VLFRSYLRILEDKGMVYKEKSGHMTKLYFDAKI
jgi:hypothetical protein